MRTQKVAIAFGRVLREIRQQKGISQDNLASLCDFDRTYPSLLERGLRSPSLAMVFRLSVALDVNPSSLVRRTYDELQRVVL
jgi:transcriptional regulator with XRE-family HTH domain